MAKKKEEELTKSESIQLALVAIEKAHGKGAVMFGRGERIPNVEVRSSGCLSVDKALGGGFRSGGIVEIYGPESSGKTTLALHAIAEAQKNDEVCAFVDVEHAIDPEYAENLGVDFDKLILSQPNSGEEALQIVEALTGIAGIIVIDSVAALLPQAEIEKEIGAHIPGRQAALMSQAMRKLSIKCSKAKSTLIFINQIRMKIGIMFGSPETTSGGNALKFYASQRIDIRRTGGVKDGTELVANSTRVKVVKNKIAPPFKQAEFEIKYSEGINIYADLLNQAVETNIVQKSGSWYSYGGNRLGQGSAAVARKLQETPELFKEIWDKVTQPNE